MNFLRGSSQKNDTSHISNEEILKAKGLWSYFQEINPKIINKRVCMGWLRKRSKGKTKYFQNRWFIMVSARELKKNCELDEEILNEGKLPPWMELETIYYFDDKEILNDAKALKDIPMKECLGVIVKDMSKSRDKGFTFKIDMGDRIFHLNASNVADVEQWKNAIEMSIETYKQQRRSRLGGLKKNIALLDKIYAEGGASKLQDKVVDDYLSMEAAYPVNDLDNLDEYIRQSQKMSEDLIFVIDACMAVDPPKKEYVFEYLPIYHEKTCQLPTIYYENNRKTLTNLDIMKLLNWLYSYSNSLTMFGIKDERLVASTRALSTLLTKKMLKAGAKMVFNILLEVRDSTALISSESLQQTNGPLDLFKILSETFETYKRCQFKEVAEKLLVIIRKQIFYYQNYLEIILKTFRFSVEKYIGFSNDTLAYVKNTNEFGSNVRQMASLEEQEVEELLDREEINKRFLRIGDVAFEKLVDAAFQNLADYFKVNFMELDMDSVLANIIGHQSEIYKNLHPSYLRKVWKLCLDKVIILYLQCLLNSANKLKIKDINMLIDKMYVEKDLCKPTFKARGVSASAIEASADVLQELIGFFEAGPAFVPLRILDLRKSHGPSFNFNAVKALMNLRVDFTSSERSSSLKECKEILSKYKEETGGAVKPTGVNLFQRIEVAKQEADDDDEEEKSSVDESFEDTKTEDSSPKTRRVTEAVQENKLGLKALEGFLEKKSAGFTKVWEKRYFALKNGKLYWYNHERARTALNSLDVKEVKRCEAGKDRQFDIEYEGKVYKLNAPTVEERDKWVQVINELVEELNDTEPKFKNESDFIKIIPGGSLFYDYESEWRPMEDEIAVLKGLKDPRVLEDPRATRSKTYSTSPPKKNAKEDRDRRKSIVFDDLSVEVLK